MSADDPGALVAQARWKHVVRHTRDRDYCSTDLETWPCHVARLADALELAQAIHARFAQSLQVVRGYAEEIARSVPPGDGQGCAENIQRLVDDTLAGNLPSTLEFLNAAERGRLEWYRKWDAARAENAALREALTTACDRLDGVLERGKEPLCPWLVGEERIRFDESHLRALAKVDELRAALAPPQEPRHE